MEFLNQARKFDGKPVKYTINGKTKPSRKETDKALYPFMGRTVMKPETSGTGHRLGAMSNKK